MTRILPALALAAFFTQPILTASAQERFLMDFGRDTRTTGSPTSSLHWNNLTARAPGTSGALVNTSGSNTSGVTLSIVDQFGYDSLNGNASTTAAYPYSASSDFWYIQRGNGTDDRAVIRLNNLDITGTKVYDLKFFVSSNRGLPQKFITDYRVAGNTTVNVSLEAVGNTQNTAQVVGMQANWRGQITIICTVNPDSYSDVASAFGALGVMDVAVRAESNPPPQPPNYSAIGDTPNPPAVVSTVNPEGLRAYVLESTDGFTNRVGLGELLRRAGFHVMPLPLDQPPFTGSDPEQDVDLIAFGSMAADSAEYQEYMAQYGDLLDDYIDRAGMLFQFAQPDQTELRPPFLPDTQDAARNDTDFAKSQILAPNHLLLMDVPKVDDDKAIQFTLWDETTPNFSDNVQWESFMEYFGFEVILSGDARGATPGLMEGAYGQGRFFVSALAIDKIIATSTEELTETQELREFNDVFFKNMYDYAALVRDRATPPINVTPPPGASDVPEGAWSIVLLPDTQIYSQNYPGMYEAQTAWIADNVRTRNIKFVIHLGDITNVNSIPEWKVARKAMANLDGAVPYSLTSGNHDVGPGGNAATRDSYMNDYFSVNDYRKLPTWGGIKDAGKLENTYHLFSAGGVDFIIMVLEWGPRQEAIDWAASIMDQHPGRIGIFVTHAFMNNNDLRYNIADTANPQDYNPHKYSTPGPVNDGEELWQKLVKQKNFRLTLNGHVLGDGTGFRVDDNDAGATVNQMLVNYQFRSLGGEGYLRILEFQPDGETVKVMSYSPIYNKFLTNADQEFEFLMPLGAADMDNDGILDYYDDDFDDDGDGISNLQEFVVLGTSSSTLDRNADGKMDGLDSDWDGISDVNEIAAGTDPNRNNAKEYAAVKNNRDDFGLYTPEDITDISPGTALISVEGGEATLSLQLEQMGETDAWEPLGEGIDWSIPVESESAIYRIKVDAPQ